MNFNQNKTDLLKQISQQKQNQIMDRRNLEAKNRIKEKTTLSGGISIAEIASLAEAEKTRKPSVVIFGLKSLFLSTLKNILLQYCNIHEFNEVESACEFLLSNKVPIAVMDMDPPNDWQAANNLFSTGKTINPTMQYIIYQKEEKKLAEPVEVLQKQGATILRKPIDRIELIDWIKKFTAQWREENAQTAQ